MTLTEMIWLLWSTVGLRANGSSAMASSLERIRLAVVRGMRRKALSASASICMRYTAAS